MNKTIYFYIGGYCHPLGMIDYIKAFKNYCEQFLGEVKIVISWVIVENEVNIFIESLSEAELCKLIRVKERFPRTRYLVILTEFMSNLAGHVRFNLFEPQDIEWETHLVNSLYGGNRYLIKSRINTLIRLLRTFKFGIDNQLGVNIHRLEYNIRSRCLEKFIPYIDMVLKAHSDIDKDVQDIFSDTLVYDFPFWINPDKIDVNNKWGICFSGNLTEYRRFVINNVFESVSSSRNDRFAETFRRELGMFDEIFDSCLHQIRIYQGNYIDKPKNELFEVYIPQSESWPYISPMRVYHALLYNRFTCIVGNIPDITMKPILIDINALSEFSIADHLRRLHQYNTDNSIAHAELAAAIQEIIAIRLCPY